MIRFILKMLFINGLVFCSCKSTAQTINFSSGLVESFAIYRNDSSSVVLVDTVVGQYRSFAVDTIAKKIGVEWLIEKDTIRIQYHIERIYTTRNYNSRTNKTTENLNILSFDSDEYPLLLLLPLENKDLLYVYYYWNNKADVFQKSEKIVISSNKNISNKK